jgi:MFS family permease
VTFRSPGYARYALALLASANLLHYAVRNVVFHTTVYAELRSSFSLTNAELGFLGTMAFMVPHAIATLPVGWFADRFDRRRVMAIGLVVWSTGTLLFALASGFATLLVARAVTGLGCAACVPVANALICDVFPEHGKARRVSLFNFGLFLGGVVGLGCASLFGYPTAFFVVAAPGFALAYLIATLDVGTPRPASRGSRTAAVSWRSFFRDAGSTFRVRTLRWMFVGAVLMAFAAGGYLGWFIDFLYEAKQMSQGQATTLFGIALAAGLAGVLTGGILADRLYARRPGGRQLAVTIGFAAAVPCALAAIYLPRGPAFYASACLLMYFAMWYHGPVAAAVDDLAPANAAATSQGVYIFLMHLLGTAPSSWAVGWLRDQVGIEHALLLPTAAMALAAVAFAISSSGVAADLVVKASRE